MSNFIVSDWFAKRAKLSIQLFDVEGVQFELMALTSDLKEKVELCDTYEDMLSMAADFGLSYNRKRVIDDPELAKDIEMLWEIDNLAIELDPCIKYRVGEKVCQLSGLTPMLEDTLEAERQVQIEAGEAAERLAELKDQGHINGDSETPDVYIDELNDDELAEQSVSQ